MFGWPWGGLLYVRDKFPFALGQPEAPNLQILGFFQQALKRVLDVRFDFSR